MYIFMKNFKADKLGKQGYLNKCHLCREGLSTVMQDFDGYGKAYSWDQNLQYPPTASTEIQKMILNFFWDGEIAKTRRRIIIDEKNNGC